MNSRSGELNIGAAAIRSIWDDNGSSMQPPTGSTRVNSVLHRFGNNFDNHSKSNLGSAITTTSSHGPVGAPLCRGNLGGYDSSASPYAPLGPAGGCLDAGYSTASDTASQLSSGLLSHRSSVSSLWDQSSGYSSGPSSPLYPGRSVDFGPSSKGYAPMLDHHSERDRQIDLISQALGTLLISRDFRFGEKAENLKELLGFGGSSNRRASVATSGGLALERERHLMLNGHHRYMHDGSDSLMGRNQNGLSSMLGSGPSGSTIYANSQSPYEIALERIEREAKMRRTSAYQTDTSFTWKGTLTTRFHDAPTYATKVFVGGLPYDVTPEALTELFGKFGLISVQFPPRGRGHAYLVFDTEQQVQNLLDCCESKGPGQFFYWVASRRGKDRQAQIIPWATEDSDWLAASAESTSSYDSSESSGSASVDSLSDSDSSVEKCEASPSQSRKSSYDQNSSSGCKQNTVFVGALHGEITAEGLQKILSELFGPVVHVGIDTDKNRYPNGSARVTFASRESFHSAVSAEFVQVVTPRFSKTIQLDAYIEDGVCSECKVSTPVFCRNEKCFRYYCPLCFDEHRRLHSDYHPPVMRNRNNSNNYNGQSGASGRKDRSASVQSMLQ